MCGAPASTTARSSAALTAWISPSRTTTWLINPTAAAAIPPTKPGMIMHVFVKFSVKICFLSKYVIFIFY